MCLGTIGDHDVRPRASDLAGEAKRGDGQGGRGRERAAARARAAARHLEQSRRDRHDTGVHAERAGLLDQQAIRRREHDRHHARSIEALQQAQKHELGAAVPAVVIDERTADRASRGTHAATPHTSRYTSCHRSAKAFQENVAA